MSIVFMVALNNINDKDIEKTIKNNDTAKLAIYLENGTVNTKGGFYE